ncbi:MAG: hypothetical protein QXD13_00895 [Candidatus Pacearchaeota archaeon]
MPDFRIFGVQKGDLGNLQAKRGFAEANKNKEEVFVEAIEDGKIVKVPEEYARREGLLVLRKQPAVVPEQQRVLEMKQKEKRDKETFLGIDSFRRPLKSEGDEILSGLVENFHWQIVQKRKTMRLTRKQVADAINETELSLKMVENGVLPEKNFVLVNKLENFLGLKLRKEGAGATMRSLVEKSPLSLEKKDTLEKKKIPLRKSFLPGRKEEKQEAAKDSGSKNEALSGSDIELYFDE